MKLFLTSIFLMIVFLAKPCGWYPESDSYNYYNLLDQKNVSNEDYYSFLRNRSSLFNYEENSDYSQLDGKKGNLNLWKELLPTLSLEEIYRVVYENGSKDEYWQKPQNGFTKSVLEYLLFAERCQDRFDYRKEYSWNYDEMIDDEEAMVKEPFEVEELGLAMALYNTAQNAQLKQRYAYQIVRIHHYTRHYLEATKFFESNVASNTKNEIYYYTLDQVAGCYYSLEDYEQSAYCFINVFSSSKDKKESSFLSYRLCLGRNAEGQKYIKSKNDSIAYLTMKNVAIFSDPIAGAKEMIKLAPEDDRTELVFARSLNDLEREIWPTFIGFGDQVLPMEVNSIGINELLNISAVAVKNTKIKNPDFWRLAHAYLLFLNKDYGAAKDDLKLVKKEAFLEQKNLLWDVVEVFSWKEIGQKEEQYLSVIMESVMNGETISSWDELKPPSKYLILDRVANIYYKRGDLAKSFLIHNSIQEVEAISSLELIDDLLVFVKKDKKTGFENLLMRKILLDSEFSVKSFLLNAKGVCLLKKGEHVLASQSLLESVQSSKGNVLISNQIFSNNIKERFDVGRQNMDDLVYSTSLFSFIKIEFTVDELSSYLLKLDSLSQEELVWKQKLANYLLGNYYFNISNTGNFRGALSGKSNCCESRYLPHRRNSATSSYYIQNKKGYNLLSASKHTKTYFAMADKAFDYYQKVIGFSKDRELNARCLYLMAKCELNRMYNVREDLYDYYSGDVDEKSSPYKLSFAELKNDYQDTKFYNMIIEECSFFRYYCSM